MDGTVVKIMDFGAFVNIAPGKDGMIHISKLSNKRVEKVEDVVSMGFKVKVEIMKVDDKGRIDLKLIEIL
jgi:polyribonucleotide nucleotidyltransferase